jgi:hypothetical protein
MVRRTRSDIGSEEPHVASGSRAMHARAPPCIPGTVQAQKVRHGPPCDILVARSKPAERVQSTAGNTEVHDRTTPEIDEQRGSRTLNHYSAPSIDDDFGVRCRQHRNHEGGSGD